MTTKTEEVTIKELNKVLDKEYIMIEKPIKSHGPTNSRIYLPKRFEGSNAIILIEK